MNKNAPRVKKSGENMEHSSSSEQSTETYTLHISDVKHITQAFLALNKQGRIIYPSQQATQILGQTREELTDKCIWDVFPEMVDSPLYQHCLQAVASGQATQFQIEAPRYSKWFHIHIFPSPDEVAIFFSDITEHKRAIEQLRFQADILHNVRDSVIVTDLEGRVRYWNEGATAIFGYTAEEMMDQTMASLYEEGHATQLAQDLQLIFDGHDYVGEWRGRRKDGTVVWIDGKTTLLRNAAGKITGFIGVSKDITGRKRAEELAEQSEKRFRALIENSVDSITLLDASGTILYTSPSVTRTLGYAAEELIGHAAAELVHPDELEKLRTIFSTIMQEAGKSTHAQFQVRHKDGTFRWVRGSGLNLLHDPAVAAVVINYQDITERKHIIEERQRLSAIVKSSDDAITGITIDGIITSWNKGAQRIYGYTAEEALGKPIALIRLPDREGEFAANMQKLQRGESIDHSETLRRRKDGTIITVSVSSSPVRDDTGAIIGVSSIARDITKQKQLEAEILHARQQLEVILQHIADGILVQNPTGTIIYANHKAAMLAGYASAEEILQISSLAYWEQFEITDEEGHRLPLSQLAAGGIVEKESSSQVNVRLVARRTREVHWVSIKSTAVLAGEQVPSLVISVLQDITQFKELEQHKDEFIMHVSHELRTPLAAVSGYLELLQDHGERLDASSKAQFLNQALENCQVLADLVNTVINVLKIKQDAKPLKSEQLAVASIVHEVIEQFDPRKWQEYHCQLDIPDDLFVYADKQYFCQVLRNLISNVFKYAPKQTPLLISAAPIARDASTVSEVCISVQDAGPGIPPAEQPFLFQKFIRLKRDLTSTVRGTGLGLYICKELLVKMDGRIWVESSGKEGEGSRFSFTLPAARP